MVIHVHTLYTLDSKTLLGFSDFIPTNSAADWATGEDWGSGGGVVVVVVVCVWGGDEAISKLKGAGATHALPRSYLHVSILLCASFHINHLCST